VTSESQTGEVKPLKEEKRARRHTWGSWEKRKGTRKEQNTGSIWKEARRP